MNFKKKLIIISLSIIFILLVVLYYTNSIDIIDNFFYDKLILLKNSFTTNIFKFFTHLGGFFGTVLLIVIVSIVNKKKGIYFLLNIGIILLLNFIIKNIIMRARPIDINMIIETGYSFPSGHTMTSVASYGLIIYYLFNSNLKKLFKISLISLSFVAMLMIPISRVYLGVHFFSDILAGACLSIIWLILYTNYLKSKDI